MLSFLSSKFRFLLIVVLIILGISFIFFDQSQRGHGESNPKVAVIEGKTIKRQDYEVALRSTSLIYTLQTGRRAEPQMERIFRAQTWNRLLILAAAKEAGISATTEQAVNFIKNHPLFKDEKGNYSPAAFQFFGRELLKPQGISEERFQEIIQNQIIFEQMLKTISSTAVVRPSEVEEAFASLYGQVTIKYVLLPEGPIRASIQPTEDELKDFYQKNQANFLSPELRKVDYVLFTLKPDQAKLPEEQKNAALKVLMQEAYRFTEPFFNDDQTAPEFKSAAAKAGLNVQTSTFVTRKEPLLPGDPSSAKLTDLAFILYKKSPVSDFQQISNGFAVLHLAEIQVPAAVPFDKVSEEIGQLYITNKTLEQLTLKGKTLAKELQSAVASGQTWEKAAGASGLKSITVPSFSPAREADLKSPAADAIRFWAQRLKVGAVSEFSRSTEGGMVFFLAERKIPSDANQEQARKNLEEQIGQQRRYQILDEWISARVKKKGNNIPPDLLSGEVGETL